MNKRDLPPGVPEPLNADNWIKQELTRGAYVFYNAKTKTATCSVCGKTFSRSLVYGKHNEQTVCPHCGTTVILKASGRGRENLTEYLRTVTFRRRGRTVFGYLTEVDIIFSEDGPPVLRKNLTDVYIFNSNKQEHWKYRYNYEDSRWIWNKCRRVNLPTAPSANAYTTARYWFTPGYIGNIIDIFRNSDLKYLECFLPHIQDPYAMIQLMAQGLKYPSIEMLYKAGFQTLVFEKLQGNTSRELNWRGKSLQKVLKLPRRQVRFLQKMNPRLHEVLIYKLLTEEEKDKMTEAEFNFLTSVYNADIFLKKTRKYTKLTKLAQYALTQPALERLGDWIDYIECADKLGMDVTRKSVLFPKNFTEAHDKATRELKIKADSKKNEEMKSKAFGFQFEADELITIEAIEAWQLADESQQLGHCVRTYVDRVAAGKSHIFLIRHKGEMEKSFYTLEVNAEGKFIQCRGSKNRNMTDEVETFVEGFKKELSKYLRQQERKSA